MIYCIAVFWSGSEQLLYSGGFSSPLLTNMTKPQPERKPVRWWHFLHEWSRYVPLPSYPNIQVSTCEICGKQRHYHISNNY